MRQAIAAAEIIKAAALIMVAIQQVLDPVNHYQSETQPLCICPLRNADEQKKALKSQTNKDTLQIKSNDSLVIHTHAYQPRSNVASTKIKRN